MMMKMTMTRAAVLSFMVGMGSAFAPGQMLAGRSTAGFTTNEAGIARNSHMLGGGDNMQEDPSSSMGIVNAANFCAQEEGLCGLEEEEALMNELESEAHSVAIRLEEMQSMAYSISDGSPAERRPSGSPAMADEMEAMMLLNAASYCAEEGCELEDKEILADRLEEQSTAWNLRLMEMISALKRLATHNTPQYRGDDADSLMHTIDGALTMDYDMPDSQVPVDDSSSYRYD